MKHLNKTKISLTFALIIAIFTVAVYGLGFLGNSDSFKLSSNEFITSAVVALQDETETSVVIDSQNEVDTQGEIGTQATYCGGEYDDTDVNWTINTSISCSNEVIPVLGTLTIQDNSENEVSEFSESTNAYFDLSSNSAVIVDANPDGNPSTPAEYTTDWAGSRTFLIAMNETEHQIQMYFDYKNPDSDRMIGVNVDGSIASGSTFIGGGGQPGIDIFFGPESDYGGTMVVVFNESSGFYQPIPPGTTVNTVYDSALTQNFTVYYTLIGSAFEMVINITGPWTDKLVELESDPDYEYTTFKNSTINTNGVGSLTLENVTLGVVGNFTVTGNLTVNNSNITLNTPNNVTEIKFDSGSITRINHTYIQSNGSYNYSFYVAASDFIMENGQIDHLCDGCGTGGVGRSGIVMAGTGGTINNITFGSNIENSAIHLDVGSNIIISNNNVPSGTIFIQDSSSNSLTDNSVGTFAISNDASDNIFSDNTIGIMVNLGMSASGDENNIFLNNNFSTASIVDQTSTDVSNYFIYNNSFGEIKWYLNNLSTPPGVDLNIGTNVYVEDNTLGIADDTVNLTNFNTSAELKFYGLSWVRSTEQFCDNIGGVSSNCLSCNSTYNCTYSTATGIMQVNVTHFSNYTTNGSTDNLPNVTLVIPAASYSNDSAAITEINFSCNVTDDNQLQNISLYLTNNADTSFALNQSTNVSGTSNSTSWLLNLTTGSYTWNCLAYDNASLSDWGDANRTITLGYTAPVAEEEAATVSSSSGGGTGATQIVGEFAKVVWGSIATGGTATVSVENGEVGVTEVRFDAGKDLYGVWLKVEKTDELPNDVSSYGKKIYKYIEITKSIAFKDGDIVNPEIDFKVKKSWLTDEGLSKDNVALFRYVDGVWTELTTTVGEDDGTYVHYNAETPGFSYFAIAQKEEVSKTVVEEIEEPEQAVTEEKTIEEKIAEVKVVAKKVWPWLLAGGVILILAIALVLSVIRNKIKAKKVDKAKTKKKRKK